ncbi:hypothetical protein EOW77_0003665 [Bradyrhizobium yuanmingense]|uniref:hypothetical protein n=1 Tax=Bradyrhizobium yuanmingense TaxID=108015 RepID=UPI000FE2BA9A|nr:hypothetical protein [Bradyrhizobium yuanmingense]TGN89434.1 hypothetical protein EOW77_0003665 [Bradyrhizobium yuanmingense]
MRLLNYYIEGRRFEWLITIAMLWLAVATFVSPEILRASAFQWITLVMTPWFTACLLFAIGWARLVGLLLNGHQVRGRRVGPMIRAVTAAACAVMWVQFDLALIQLSVDQGFMSPGVPFWSMFVLGELDVAYRVVANGRTS